MTFDEMLLDKGLIPYLYWTVSNDRLWVPKDFGHAGIWALPSSVMKAPVLFRKERFFLVHNDLRHHPYVAHVEKVTGLPIHDIEPHWQENYLWRHAIDLVSKRLYDELFQTRNLTTENDIAGAISHCMSYVGDDNKPPITGQVAKQLMARFGIVEPSDKSRETVRQYQKPIPQKIEDRAETYPVNGRLNTSSLQRAWATIHGLEFGWFTTKTGWLSWTKAGIEHHEGNSLGLLL